ncbi:hypothetical protein [Staphylococcus equorum]|uniref:Uncharacterized protein n=1 Tax=Staphylococcus equorum TaxID=246432 RepID=A0AAP7LV55_9STAP|nr:hypothetical protein [Staphylococcus equorum]OEK59087.1 hypothetical protein ASS94_00035 [Staphylococcus equorum]
MTIVVADFLIILIGGLFVYGSVVFLSAKKKSELLKKEFEKNEYEDNMYISGVITKKDAVKDGQYFIELDNQRVLKTNSFKKYKALPLNKKCKTIVKGETIQYVDGLETFTVVSDKVYKVIEKWIYITLMIYVVVGVVYGIYRLWF